MSKTKDTKKDQTIEQQAHYIKTLEQSVANQAVLIAQLTNNITVLQGQDK